MAQDPFGDPCLLNMGDQFAGARRTADTPEDVKPETAAHRTSERLRPLRARAHAGAPENDCEWGTKASLM